MEVEEQLHLWPQKVLHLNKGLQASQPLCSGFAAALHLSPLLFFTAPAAQVIRSVPLAQCFQSEWPVLCNCCSSEE